MAEGETPNRESVLESIALVFSQSKLKDVVGKDALKSVLSGQYRDLVHEKTLRLQVVWDLLSDQPDFDAELAVAPFSVLKTWEDELGLTVEVPRKLASLSSTQLLAQASHCPVKRSAKTRALNPENARTKARETMSSLGSTGITQRTAEGESTRKPALEAALGLVALLGLAYGGYTYYGTMAGPQYKSVPASLVRGDLPVAKAKQLGEELNITITEASWYELSADTRKESLRASLEAMGHSDVKSIIVFDATGAIRASAQWFGSPPTINVRLQ